MSRTQIIAIAAIAGLVGAIFGSILTIEYYVRIKNKREGSVLYIESEANKTSKSSSPSLNISNFSFAVKEVVPAVTHLKNTYNRKFKEIKDPNIREYLEESYENYPFKRNEAAGSAVLISPDGYLITNYHVIEKATSTFVYLFDNRKYEAEIIGVDIPTDIALLKINAKNLPYIRLGNSDSLEIGDWVMAVGNPFDLNSTVTAGIVSAKARAINILQKKSGAMSVESFIQTDAAVNPGNSGGALINSDGNLVGIITAIATQTGSYVGYSFAIPISIVKKVVQDLEKYSKVQRASMGVVVTDLNAEIANEEGLDVNEGALVVTVGKNSPAENAGLLPGDVIISLNKKSIRSTSNLQEYLALKSPEDSIFLKIKRRKKEKQIAMELGSESSSGSLSENKKIIFDLGLVVEECSAEDFKNSGLKNGIKVSKILPGPIRNQTLMKQGFIISDINKTPVFSPNKFEQLINNEEKQILLEGAYENGEKAFFIIN